MDGVIQLGNNEISIPIDLISPINHISPATGLIPQVLLLKQGASAYVVASGAVTEAMLPSGGGSGTYVLAPNAVDANTLGMLKIRVQATSGNDPQDYDYLVVNFDPTQVPEWVWNYGTRLLTGTQPVIVPMQMLSSMDIEVSRRYSYLTEFNSAWQWTVPSPNLADLTTQFSIKMGLTWQVLQTGTVSGTYPNQTVTIQLPNNVIANLNVGSYEYALEALDGSGNVSALLTATMTVNP